MVYNGTSGRTYSQKSIAEAINRTKDAHPEWDLKGVCGARDRDGWLIEAPGSHHMKAKIREIYKEADKLQDEEEGIQTFYVSVAIDARVDVPIKAKSLEEAMKEAKFGCFDFDMDDAEVIDTSPVNISDADGNLLKDF